MSILKKIGLIPAIFWTIQLSRSAIELKEAKEEISCMSYPALKGLMLKPIPERYDDCVTNPEFQKAVTDKLLELIANATGMSFEEGLSASLSSIEPCVIKNKELFAKISDFFPILSMQDLAIARFYQIIAGVNLDNAPDCIQMTSKEDQAIEITFNWKLLSVQNEGMRMLQTLIPNNLYTIVMVKRILELINMLIEKCVLNEHEDSCAFHIDMLINVAAQLKLNTAYWAECISIINGRLFCGPELESGSTLQGLLMAHLNNSKLDVNLPAAIQSIFKNIQKKLDDEYHGLRYALKLFNYNNIEIKGIVNNILQAFGDTSHSLGCKQNKINVMKKIFEQRQNNELKPADLYNMLLVELSRPYVV